MDEFRPLFGDDLREARDEDSDETERVMRQALALLQAGEMNLK